MPYGGSRNTSPKLSGFALQIRAEVGQLDRSHIGKLRVLEVFADRVCAVAPRIDEHGVRRAAAEGLNAHLSCSGKQVEHAAPLDIKLNTIKNTFLRPLRGRARFSPSTDTRLRPFADPVITLTL